MSLTSAPATAFATASAPERSGPAGEAAVRPARVTATRVVRSEWIKFTSVRSNLLTLAGAAAATLALGLVFSSLAGTGEGPSNLATDAVSTSLGGLNLAQVFLAVLGVAFVTSEYSTGLIRTMLTVVPRRVGVLVAKAVVVGGAALVVMTATAVVTFVGSMAVYAEPDAVLSLADEGVARALAGAGLYAAAVAAMGVALGVLLRSTGAAVGLVIAVLFVAPILVGLLPADIADTVGMLLPSNAGAALRAVGDSTELPLTAGEGLAVLSAWVVGMLGAAALVLRRRDA